MFFGVGSNVEEFCRNAERSVAISIGEAEMHVRSAAMSVGIAEMAIQPVVVSVRCTE